MRYSVFYLWDVDYTHPALGPTTLSVLTTSRDPSDAIIQCVAVVQNVPLETTGRTYPCARETVTAVRFGGTLRRFDPTPNGGI